MKDLSTNYNKVRIIYDEKNDRYQLEVYDPENKEWDFDMACSFVRREGDTNTDNQYIHFSIIKELANLLNDGFKWEHSL